MNATSPMGWDPRRPETTLLPGEAQVWLLDLTPSHQPKISALKATLADDEIQRADRFRFSRDSDRFIVVRATLREILGSALCCSPREVRLSSATHGKPMLAAPHHPTDLDFNVSHSHNAALIALCTRNTVGVDLEWTGRTHEILQIAQRYFSVAEVNELMSLSDQERIEAFFNGWTRKEAFLKAIGVGLHHPLDAIEVSLKPSDPPEIRYVSPSSADGRSWRLHPLPFIPEFQSALVTDGATAVKCWRCTRDTGSL